MSEEFQMPTSKIEKWRKDKGLSRGEAALRFNQHGRRDAGRCCRIKEITWAHWELGRKSPNDANKLQLATLTKIPLSTLIADFIEMRAAFRLSQEAKAEPDDAAG